MQIHRRTAVVDIRSEFECCRPIECAPGLFLMFFLLFLFPPPLFPLFPLFPFPPPVIGTLRQCAYATSCFLLILLIIYFIRFSMCCYSVLCCDFLVSRPCVHTHSPRHTHNPTLFTARSVEDEERWGAGVETQKIVRGEIGGWGRVPFNEPYAPLLSTIYDGA